MNTVHYVNQPASRIRLYKGRNKLKNDVNRGGKCMPSRALLGMGAA